MAREFLISVLIPVTLLTTMIALAAASAFLAGTRSVICPWLHSHTNFCFGVAAGISKAVRAAKTTNFIPSLLNPLLNRNIVA
jgi:hypothetical protein